MNIQKHVLLLIFISLPSWAFHRDITQSQLIGDNRTTQHITPIHFQTSSNNITFTAYSADSTPLMKKLSTYEKRYDTGIMLHAANRIQTVLKQ